MTWFEIEQIAHFVNELDAALDEWTLTNVQMREKLAELRRIAARLEQVPAVRSRASDPVIRRAVQDLRENLRACDRSIRDRLVS